MIVSHPIPTPLSLDAILSHEFVGNAASDLDAFMQVDRWCREPGRSPDDICAALNHVSVAGMGISEGLMVPADVPEFLADD